jgi:hypothetical protein
MLLMDFGPYGIKSDCVCFITLAMVMLFVNPEPYGIIFMTMCVFITVDMVMLLRNFGPHRVIFMTVRLLLYIFPLFLTAIQ